MKERPILFNDAMVLAILAGTKTQTRRVIPDAGGAWWDHRGYHPSVDADGMMRFRVGGPGGEEAHLSPEIRHPYGAPGDRLWVREAWGVRAAFDFTDWRRDTLRGCTEAPPGTEVDFRADYGLQREACFWRPSIHMPRWASRLTLEITSVRVERVQSISEEDARAEGVEPLLVPPDGGSRPHVEGFAALWDSINGEREGCSWSANPWVWVLGFRRMEVSRG